MTMAAAQPADPGDRIVGKKQLCALLNWSRPTLDRRIDQDPNFPIHSRGDQRGGWGFDVVAVFAYLHPDAAAPAITPAAPEPPPIFVSPAAPAGRVVHLGEKTSRQRRDDMQAELLSDRLKKNRGDLVEASAVRMALSTAVTKLGASLNALPDVLVRRLSLPEAAGGVIRQEIEDARRAFFAQLRDVLPRDPSA